MNPKDPMLKAGPDQQRELFTQFAQLASGFSTEDVIGSAMNLLVNAIRQSQPKQKGALDRLDQLNTKTRELLAAHYDVIGNRRNVFPFHQVIQMGHFDSRATKK